MGKVGLYRIKDCGTLKQNILLQTVCLNMATEYLYTMRAFIASDTHLGWEKANSDDFLEFLQTTVRDEQPDKLILAGDIFEMWRRGITSTLLEHSNITSELYELDKDGIEVIPVAGNHDWRCMKVNKSGSVPAPDPWNFRETYEFTAGSTDYVVTHGHQMDGGNANPARNEALCLTSDNKGTTISDGYSRIASGIFGRNGFKPSDIDIEVSTINTAAHVSNPGVLAEPEYKNRAQRIVDRINNKYEEYVIFGHTHLPALTDEYANCGSWTGNTNTYVEVDDEEVHLKQWE